MATITDTWDTSFEAYPAGTDDPRVIDNAINAFKRAVSERTRREHYFTPGSDNAKHGLHLAGSAVVFTQDAEPTTRPDGDALDSDDDGRVWIDTNDSNALYFYDGSAWIDDWKMAGNLTVGGILTASGTLTDKNGNEVVSMLYDWDTQDVDDLASAGTQAITLTFSNLTTVRAIITLTISGVNDTGDQWFWSLIPGSDSNSSAAPDNTNLRAYVVDAIALSTNTVTFTLKNGSNVTRDFNVYCTAVGV